MNAVPDATSKPTVADGSKDGFQSSFASVIGAAVAAATSNGDAKPAKAQNVETKKTSSPESGKKNDSSSSVDALPAAHEIVPVSIAVPVVPQVAVPQVVVPQAVAQQESGSSAKEILASTGTADELKSSAVKAVSTINTVGSPDVANPGVSVALPPVAGKSDETTSASSNQSIGAAKIDSTATPATAAIASAINNAAVNPAVKPVPVVSSNQNTGATKIDSTSMPAAVATTPVIHTAPVDTVGVAAAVTVDSKASAAALNTSGIGNTLPSKVDVSNPTNNTAIGASSTSAVSPVVTKEKPGVAVSYDVAAAREIVAQPLAIPVPAPAASSTPAKISASQSTTDAVIAPKVSSSDSVRPASTNVGSAPAANGPVATNVATSNPEPVNVPSVQSSSTVSVPSASASAQPQASTSPSESSSVSAPQSAEASVTAATKQADTIAMTIPQQAIAQSADAAAVPSNTAVVSSNVAAIQVPVGKSGAVGSSNQFSVAPKGRASANDWRTNRNFATSDDKSSSADADNGTIATRVVGTGTENGVVSKEVVSNIKGALDTAVLAQNAQSAQTPGQAASTPAPSTPAAATPDSSVAAGSTLPAPATSAESTQAAHALNSAQLIQSVHGSEMRLGMNSAEFGNISINTSLNHQTLSAQISMDHSALGHALAMHLPAIEEKLGSAYGLQAKVELRDTASNSTASDSSSNESRGDRRSQGGSTGTSTAALQSPIGTLTSSNFTPSSTSMAASTSRLDIRI
jgi:hypothetical protein